MKIIGALFLSMLILITNQDPLYAEDLSSILIKTDRSEREISREDTELFMSISQGLVLKTIRDIYNKMECNKSKNVLSSHAILYIGLFGEPGDASIIKDVWECNNLQQKELSPCEYYCAYEFALTLHDIRFNKRAIPMPDINRWPLFTNRFTASLKVDSVGGILATLTEDDLARSLHDKKLRPVLPSNITEGMDNSQIENFYRFSVYYQLTKVAQKESTRNELFKELLYLYIRDVSGDGGVTNLQDTLLLIEKRIASRP
ncbi:MAG: hypothetical protein HY956_08075 [Deltaproteobacteria bacterium]|nr:hypothetical protein [Deltaproteobacteria bacterium]